MSAPKPKKPKQQAKPKKRPVPLKDPEKGKTYA
jgi:hypothetical protein